MTRIFFALVLTFVSSTACACTMEQISEILDQLSGNPNAACIICKQCPKSSYCELCRQQEAAAESKGQPPEVKR